MAGERSESVDLWDVLEEAEQTVQRWPSWQQQYDADIYYDEEGPEAGPAMHSRALPPVMVCMSATAFVFH